MMFKKYYTPQEANLSLPLVRQIVRDIIERAGQVKAMMADGIGQDNRARYDKLLSEVEDLTRELEDLGCFFKDWNFEKGLVDFPAIIDGKEVFLCWHSDEPQVRWYHGLQDGFHGRRPIPDHFLFDLEKFLNADTDGKG
jgi:hypothetical protein